MLKQAEFAKRRRQLMNAVGENAIVILPAAPACLRNGDYEYPYRPQSDFYYLTGFIEPEAVAIFLPKRSAGEFILFNRTRNPSEEIWVGPRAGQEGAMQDFGADAAYPIDTLSDRLPALLEGREEIHYSLGLNPVFDHLLLNAVNKIRGKIRSGLQSPLAFVDITHTIHEMRLIKSPAEVKIMRESAKIAASAHVSAMKACRPGIYEYELEAELMYEFVRHGARFPAYTSIVGSGPNTCILHYNDNNQKIADKSLVLIDAGCEYQYYASDITRTFPANGKFSPEQAELYAIVLDAQMAGLKTLKPGASWEAAQKAIVTIITQGLVDLKILKGNVATLIEKEAYLPFYMHKSGHWLGLDVHDVGRYKANGKWRKLQPGMVLTVEPGIYISKNILNVHPRWHNMGIRIEDDVFISPTGADILSKDVPKTIDDIENLMRH